jgi:UDP-2,4-diacetamido-2,4,6-trideoxy-beta-L-altropyranose hydrolase
MAETTTATERRLLADGVGLIRTDAPPGSDEDRMSLASVARQKHPAWVVLDSYELSEKYQRALKDADLRLLLIDDNGRSERILADVLLNQNLHAQEELYRGRIAHTRLLLGTKYALLRREFVSARSQRKTAAVGRKVLVTMGGSDPANITLRVLEAINRIAIADIEVAVVAGGSNPHLASLAANVAQADYNCRILSNVLNMADLMQWADLAISAAGSVCWEYCALGLPALLVTVAENQIANAHALDTAGAAHIIAGGALFSIEEMTESAVRLMNSAAERHALSQTSSRLVDGGGAARVVSALGGRAA